MKYEGMLIILPTNNRFHIKRLNDCLAVGFMFLKPLQKHRYGNNKKSYGKSYVDWVYERGFRELNIKQKREVTCLNDV